VTGDPTGPATSARGAQAFSLLVFAFCENELSDVFAVPKRLRAVQSPSRQSAANIRCRA
jgi:hypothetical protein